MGTPGEGTRRGLTGHNGNCCVNESANVIAGAVAALVSTTSRLAGLRRQLFGFGDKGRLAGGQGEAAGFLRMG